MICLTSKDDSEGSAAMPMGPGTLASCIVEIRAGGLQLIHGGR